MLWLLYYQDETTARDLPFRAFVWCKPVLDRKVDRNANTLQQTITDAGKQDPALQAIGRTATNSHGRSMPYPPFGIIHLSSSIVVYSTLKKPLECPQRSTKIHCCLSVLLSTSCERITVYSCCEHVEVFA